MHLHELALPPVWAQLAGLMRAEELALSAVWPFGRVRHRRNRRSCVGEQMHASLVAQDAVPPESPSDQSQAGAQVGKCVMNIRMLF